MTAPTVAELRSLDLFDDLDDEELAEFAARAHISEYEAGEVIAHDGQIDHEVYLLLDGTAETFTTSANRQEPATEHVAPTYLGTIAAVTGAPLGVRVQAATKVRLAALTPQDFLDLAVVHRSVLQLVLARVRPVVSRITAIEANRERLESLGTMAAGLAHELNNPAAAAKRSSAALAESLDVLGSTIGAFVKAGLERTDAQQLVEIEREVLAAAKLAPPLGALEAADAEEAMTTALEEEGVEEAWRLAEPLAAARLDRELIARVAQIAGPATEAALRWIATSLQARELAAELSESTDRMSKLVGAVKSYAYMDRGELVDVDLEEGIETTLTILAHKLKHTSISVQREYEPEVPRIQAFGAELNQVWTNLLDNAIDALGEQGTITVAVRRDGGCVEVDVLDDGPGIPAEVREHIFDPFYTTKEVGRGTGLGLDTARRIVVERHHGSLTVETQPGSTMFRVRLPLDAAKP
jgi:signal transduction histidine kinase